MCLIVLLFSSRENNKTPWKFTCQISYEMLLDQFMKGLETQGYWQILAVDLNCFHLLGDDLAIFCKAISLCVQKLSWLLSPTSWFSLPWLDWDGVQHLRYKSAVWYHSDEQKKVVEERLQDSFHIIIFCMISCIRTLVFLILALDLCASMAGFCFTQGTYGCSSKHLKAICAVFDLKVMTFCRGRGASMTFHVHSYIDSSAGLWRGPCSGRRWGKWFAETKGTYPISHAWNENSHLSLEVLPGRRNPGMMPRSLGRDKGGRVEQSRVTW